MDQETLRKAVDRLTLEHIKILYWLNRNQNNAAIASKLGTNATDVHFMRKFIENTLKIAGVEDINDSTRTYPPDLIHTINDTVGTPPDWSKWPPELPQLDQASDSQETDTLPPSPSPTNEEIEAIIKNEVERRLAAVEAEREEEQTTHQEATSRSREASQRVSPQIEAERQFPWVRIRNAVSSYLSL